MPARKEKESEEQVEQIKKTEDKLIFRARKQLTDSEFKLLSDLVKDEEKKTGVSIVLMPYSAELVEE